MKSIIAIFILLLPFFCGSADFVSHPDLEHNFALRRLLRYINGKFKVAGRAIDVEMYCEESVPPGEPRVSNVSGKLRIVTNPLDDWQRDQGFCRKLIVLLLRAKSGNLNGDWSELPDWFVCGISQVVSEQTSCARLIRNQHAFPLLSMLAENGMFGNPADILNLKRDELTEEEKKFFLEYSKLVVLTLEKVRCFPGIAVLLSDSSKISREKFNQQAYRFLNNFNDRMIAPAYRRELWSDLVPPPEKFTRKCLETAFVSEVPELDSEGVPTGKMLKIRLEDFPGLSERGDFLLLCRNASNKLFTVSVGESREIRSLLADLRHILEADIKRMADDQPKDENTPQKTADKKAKPFASNKNASNSKMQEKSFDDLLQKSQNSDFRKEVRRFYKEQKITDSHSNKTGTVVSGINRMFSSGTLIDREVVKKYIGEILASLERRTEQRAFVDGVERQRQAVPRQIENRKKRIYGGDLRHTVWLETVSKDLY